MKITVHTSNTDMIQQAHDNSAFMAKFGVDQIDVYDDGIVYSNIDMNKDFWPLVDISTTKHKRGG